MRASDRAAIDRRLAALETRTDATCGARERIAARLELMAARCLPKPDGDPRAALLAGLADAPDGSARAALRRAVLAVAR